MTLQELQTKANTKLQEFWDALVIKQEAYFQKHGKYFQLIVTDPVVDGVDTAFEVRHPSDELHQVDVDFTFGSPIPFQIAVHTFEKENERGYTAEVVVELPDGRKFTRSRTLTDPRVDENFDPDSTDPRGTPSWVGNTSIETTSWSEIIEE